MGPGTETASAVMEPDDKRRGTSQETCDMKVLTFSGADEQIGRRLLTALVAQWDDLPANVRDTLLQDATLAMDIGAPRTTPLLEQIEEFIRRHGATVRARP
jgi:hypothetical protein